MKNISRKPVFITLGVLVLSMLLAAACQDFRSDPVPTAPVLPELGETAGYTIVAEYPHDPGCYTQGLLVEGDVYYESCGRYGESNLRKVDLTSGEVQVEVPLDAQYFAEGMTAIGDLLYQVTWQENTGFIYNKADLSPVGTFNYTTQGWGLASDGSALILSDGTNSLYWHDPATMYLIRMVNVSLDEQPVENLNELEYIDGKVFANIYLTDFIVRIDPETGEVLTLMDLGGLRPEENFADPGEVLNGIAYDSATGRLFVTGKHWDTLYEIQLVNQTGVPTATTP